MKERTNGGHAVREKRIMIIEDDPDVRSMISILLSLEGYDVVPAEHGRRALDLLRGGERPDLILIDLIMPVMDGWHFRAEQVRDPELAPIPAVVISGGDRIAEHTRSLGAADYLRKPIDAEVLLATVRRYV